MQIAILDDYQNVARSLADWESLPGVDRVHVFTEPLGDEDVVAEVLRDMAVVCLMRERTPFPGSLIARLPALRLIVTSGMRNAAIDLEAAAARGIPVCGTESPGHATAELTWGLILAAQRQIPAEAASMRSGGWQTALGRDLRGRTLGVIGLGRLGGQVATVGLAFGMRVLAWSENLTDARAGEIGATRVDKQTLLRESDVVTIHMLLSGRTRGLIGADELALMKPDAWLVNTSRGPIVDTGALVTALRDGVIGGAAVDVYDSEPAPADHPLRDLPNTLCTPHIGYVTRETYEVFYPQMAENVAAWLAGTPIRVIGQAHPGAKKPG